jgi:DNA-binding transcriptional ArsR family regulator
MKRDMDLVRKILFEIERQPFTRGKITLEIEGYSHEEISYHVLLLSEADLIEADVSARASAEYKPIRLTWQGHEFLEAVRDEARWNKLKDMMGKVGGFVYEIAKPLAIDLLKDQISLLLR